MWDAVLDTSNPSVERADMGGRGTSAGAVDDAGDPRPVRRILFVDDEPNVLSALRRMTRARRDIWACHFAQGGAAALDIIDRHSIDVVVSDMRMPGMDGADLLGRVRERSPNTTRIVLSGHAREDSILRVIGPAHQYLAKPCDQSVLEAAIDRALDLRAVLDRPDLLALIGALDNLPSPEDRHLLLMQELASPTASAGSIAALIGEDVAMMADLLRVTNSQYFALTREVTTAEQAVRLLGVETVRLLAIKARLFRHFSGAANVAKIMRAVDRRAVEMAGLIRDEAHAAGMTGHRVDHAACAGMLWEVGLLPLLERWPDRLRPLIEQTRQGTPLSTALRRHLGASHREVGGYLLGLWGFSTPVVEAVTRLDDDGDGNAADRPDSLLPLMRRAHDRLTTPL